jgi:hypothetical protein
MSGGESTNTVDQLLGHTAGLTNPVAERVLTNRTLIQRDELCSDTMGQNRKVPTAEEVAEASGGDIETAQRALSVVRIRDESHE